MTARLPRSRLLLTAKDMVVGDRAWISSNFNLEVFTDGRVWLRKSASLLLLRGPQPWPAHQRQGEHMVEMTDEGLVLHVFKEDRFPVGAQHDHKDLLAFARIELHTPEAKPCEGCSGRGFFAPVCM